MPNISAQMVPFISARYRFKVKMKKVTKNSPVGFQYINFSGHFTFRKNKKKINIKKVIEKIEV